MLRMLGAVARLPKRLNWALRHWSTASDRAFHDAAFSRQTDDPLAASYPGYLTIRRFADLAEPHARTAESALDLGCGPGEITCELARRLPACRFIGVDHSSEAIARAEHLATRLNLTNIRFERHDLEGYDPPRPAGLVMMFDAFHHLLDPAGFVRRLAPACDRFFLIEPAGNWLGQWQKTLDLDWLSEAILVIRDRLEYQYGLTPLMRHGATAPPPLGEPTEHRYSIDDFERWFAGYGVDIRGTVAGLETYGVAPDAHSDLRNDIGCAIHNLIVELEATLHRHGLDLAAKHWAVYAERGRSVPRRHLPALPERAVQRPLAGPYDVEYTDFDGPRDVDAGTLFHATLRLVNRSWRTWSSTDEDGPVFMSYHWLNAKGVMLIEDGLRSALPHPVGPRETCVAAVQVRCPDEPGRYTLALDLVHEHVTWFSRSGAPPLRIPMRVSLGARS